MVTARVPCLLKGVGNDSYQADQTTLPPTSEGQGAKALVKHKGAGWVLAAGTKVLCFRKLKTQFSPQVRAHGLSRGTWVQQQNPKP